MSDPGNGLSMDLNWEKGTLKGGAWGKPMDLVFDTKKGIIRDASGGGDVNLKYDSTSGLLKGTLHGNDAKITMTNLDLYEFLNHYYIFA